MMRAVFITLTVLITIALTVTGVLLSLLLWSPDLLAAVGLHEYLSPGALPTPEDLARGENPLAGPVRKLKQWLTILGFAALAFLSVLCSAAPENGELKKV